ncbi:hypothetical protein CMO89_04310 [Candidatus Woesearchaeota archaeon]|nr:hypothetical protein [Candidatus Woesearchaeota archaeon]|tara:strand:- start:4923 stop:6428 length:1506 start_codon:yes stop_codon:yes gene_type:complete
MKFIVLGLDGVGLGLIKGLKEEMPNLNRLLNDSAYGKLRTVYPPLTAATWTSFQTGKDIGRHKVINFFRLTKDFKMHLTSGLDVKEKTFYEIFDENNKKVFLLNLPYTRPPKIKGDIVYSWLCTGDNKDINLFHPKSLPEKYPVLDGYTPFTEHSKGYLKTIKDHLKLTKKICSVIEEIAKHDYDLSCFIISSTDWVQHKIYDKLLNNKNGRLARESKKIFAEVDRTIGNLLGKMDKDTYMIILSDHGFREFKGKFFVNTFLKNGGYLSTTGEGSKIKEDIYRTKKKRDVNLSWLMNVIKSNKLLYKLLEPFYTFFVYLFPFNIIKSKIDIKNSKAYCSFGCCPIIKINDNLDDKERNKIKQDIIKELKATGKVEGHDITTFYKGLAMEGDIIIDMKDYEIDNTFSSKEFLDIPRFHHSKDGFFLVKGMGIDNKLVKGARIIDIQPTMLYLAGLPIPADVDGKVLDIFRKGFARKKAEYSESNKSLKEKERIKSVIRSLSV